jgi:HD-like signal output (HDOD) protein
MAAQLQNADGGQLAKQLSQVVLGRIAGDKLVLLSYGPIAARCLELVRSSDTSLSQLAAAIERDPILTVQLLREANVGTLAEATQRLGISRLRTWLGEAAARQVSESRNKRIADSARAVWEHSLGVAILARDLAALAQAESPEAAFVAGLLHDVGKSVIAGMLLEVERQMGSGRNALEMSGEDWQRAVSDCHRPIGEALAAKWSLPRAVARCIKDVTEYDAADRGSPVNFVVFANALTKRSGLYPGSFDAEEVGALELIGRSMLGLQDDLVARLVAGLAERVKSQLA